ncbi:MAG: hypothetical protein GC168_11215 [Candidatus Hydrogenedens sp.]|nr:hypothetical protein [Candidatus Hydrogenedens sp.]
MKRGVLRPMGACLAGFLVFLFSTEASAGRHSSDYLGEPGRIELEELLRLVQLYNAGAYACPGASTEDGYVPGLPACTGPFHSADYNPADGRISLGELLRVIQLFVASGYAVDCDSEDGFRPGFGSLLDCGAEGEGEGGGEGRIEGGGEGLVEGGGEGLVEGAIEGVEEGSDEGALEGQSEGVSEGSTEGAPEGIVEGTQEGSSEGTAEGVSEGASEGTIEGIAEGSPEGNVEGNVEGSAEGSAEGTAEGVVEGSIEGTPEGGVEGSSEGTPEGSVEGTPEGGQEGSVEGMADGEGASEGGVEGTTEGADGEGATEGGVEGTTEGADGEGLIDGEGLVDGEGVTDGEGITEGERLAPPYAIGSRSYTFNDITRSNRSIPVSVYYPAEFDGADAPAVTNAEEAFPVIVFGHGFLIGINFYPYIQEALVPQGFVLVLVNTETGFPDHGAFGQDLAFVADAMLAMNSQSGSPFEGLLAPKAGVAGHSMGGGATLLSVQYSSNIGAVMPLAAADTNPSAISAAENITIPAAIVSASGDCVAPPDQHQIPMYVSLPGTNRYFISIIDGSHCQFATGSAICNSGQILCLGRQYIAESKQQQITTDLMDEWFDATLRGRPQGFSVFDTLLGQFSASNDIYYEKN